jgi:CheY-like chemotaxis protein
MASILVVDDNVFIRSILTQMLQDVGHEVLTATDGQMALDMAKASPPDLIVTDYYMPVMNGADLTKALRLCLDVRLRTVPIIGLSGTADSEEQLLRAGVTAYLEKPLREAPFLEAVTHYLKK